MPETSVSRGERSRAVRDLWNRTLAQVPTAFGRIAYLASLRDPNTGRYQHFGLAQVYSEPEAELALRRSHSQVFNQWLNYPLSEQKSDLEQYLASLEGERRTVLETWGALAPYRNLMPTDATPAQKDLFLTDLEIILDLLRRELSPSSPTPAA